MVHDDEGHAAMTDMPDIMRLAAGAARHAAARQAVIAVNVANADTPGFRAQDITPFAPDDAFAMRTTRANHLMGGRFGSEAFELRDIAADPNGNTVDLEDQVLRGIEASRRHDRALTIYSSALDVLRASIGKR